MTASDAGMPNRVNSWPGHGAVASDCRPERHRQPRSLGRTRLRLARKGILPGASPNKRRVASPILLGPHKIDLNHNKGRERIASGEKSVHLIEPD